MSGRPEASIIIVNFNGRAHLPDCLESVLASGFSADRHELIVVDNGSSDGSAQWLAGRYPQIKLVSLKENLGFTGGIQAATQRATSDIFVFLNNDTRVSASWLSTIVSTLRNAPARTGTVTGKIVSWDGDRLDFCRGILTFDGHAFQPGFHRPLGSVAGADSPAPLPFPCGGNMAVRRQTWEETGGFDDDFFAYTEDVDFGWRSWIAGWDHLYEPRAVIHHRSGATGESLGLHRRGYLFEKNAFMTAYKNLDEEHFRKLMPAILWTILNRTWTLLRENNEEGSVLDDFPFPPRRETTAPAGLSPAGRREKWRRYVARIAGFRAMPPGAARATFQIRDPRTLEQLRSISFLLGRLDLLSERRKAVQAARVRSDAEYFRLFPLHLVPTYPGDVNLFESRGFARWLPEGMKLVRQTLSDIGDLA